jgi:thiol-disulfide isomerase/thioredoxin
MTARRTASLAVLVAVAAIMPACTGGPASEADVSPIPALVATPAPSLPDSVNELPEMDVAGYDALLAQLRGTPVVVNFWATWCPPCQAEAPRLVAAANEFGTRVQFLGVDILDDRASAAAFLADHGIPYPNVFDPPAAIRDSVGSFGQPVTVFYAADGSVSATVDGEISARDLSAHLDDIAG